MRVARMVPGVNLPNRVCLKKMQWQKLYSCTVVRIGVILGLYWGYTGIMESKMETTIIGFLLRLAIYRASAVVWTSVAMLSRRHSNWEFGPGAVCAIRAKQPSVNF